MEKVKGIGGLFFRARDPAALTAWYRDVLGVDPAPTGTDTPPWMAEGGVTIFTPFPDNTEYFPDTQQTMVNFRVDDLDAMLTQVRAAGAEPFNEQTMEGVGRFAHIRDPEGNAIELWQPVFED